jgi:hypothetical protein
MALEDTCNGISAAGNGASDYVERRLAFSRSMAYSEHNLEPYPESQVRPNRRTKQPTLL